jgi:hypothetical protein
MMLRVGRVGPELAGATEPGGRFVQLAAFQRRTSFGDVQVRVLRPVVRSNELASLLKFERRFVLASCARQRKP